MTRENAYFQVCWSNCNTALFKLLGKPKLHYFIPPKNKGTEVPSRLGLRGSDGIVRTLASTMTGEEQGRRDSRWSPRHAVWCPQWVTFPVLVGFVFQRWGGAQGLAHAGCTTGLDPPPQPSHSGSRLFRTSLWLWVWVLSRMGEASQCGWEGRELARQAGCQHSPGPLAVHVCSVC